VWSVTLAFGKNVIGELAVLPGASSPLLLPTFPSINRPTPIAREIEPQQAIQPKNTVQKTSQGMGPRENSNPAKNISSEVPSKIVP
jgi:hypothetical protein